MNHLKPLSNRVDYDALDISWIMMVLPFLTSPVFDNINISHGFFTRQGGAGGGIYDSLNCGMGSKDDPGTVAANRARVAEALNVPPGHLLSLFQIHSAEALIVDKPFDGPRPRADALVTATPGLAVGAVAADCAPILFAARDGTVVGAAHAGWKGAFTGIIDSTIARMEELGARREEIVAAVGPCIAQASYEVGPEFRERFIEVDTTFDAFFLSGIDPGHFQFDLPGFVRHRLQQAGIGQIDVLGFDTYADPERFFSYRRATHRDEPDYGRQISAIAIGFDSEG
jgi:YfiH family protein